MNSESVDPSIEALGRSALEEIQLKKLQLNLAGILATNRFYQGKLGSSGIADASDVRTLEDFRRLPFTTKQEVVADQTAHRPYGTNLTHPA